MNVNKINRIVEASVAIREKATEIQEDNIKINALRQQIVTLERERDHKDEQRSRLVLALQDLVEPQDNLF